MNGQIPAQLDLVLGRDSDLGDAVRQILGYGMARGLDAAQRARIGTALALVADALLPADTLRISANVRPTAVTLELASQLGVDEVPAALPQERPPCPGLERARSLCEWLEVEHSFAGCQVALSFDLQPTAFDEEDPLESAEFLDVDQVQRVLELASNGRLEDAALPQNIAVTVGRLLTQQGRAVPLTQRSRREEAR